MKIIYYHFIILSLLFLLSCKKESSQQSVPVSTSFDSLSPLDQGHVIYLNNCASCHTLYAVSAYKATQWDTLIPREVLRTGIKASYQLLLYRYLTNGSQLQGNYYYEPTNADVTTKASLVDLQKGRVLYLNNCNKCHQYYTPYQFSMTIWNTNIPIMTQYAKLDSTQGSLVFKYVTIGN